MTEAIMKDTFIRFLYEATPLEMYDMKFHLFLA